MLSSQTWLLQHGWGGNNQFWNCWKRYLPSGIYLHSLDRGYYGKQSSSSLIPDSIDLIVVHSFGLHLIPEIYFQRAKALCIISGFVQFPTFLVENKMCVIKAMIKKMEIDPQEVLNQFQKRCFFPHKSPALPVSNEINNSILISDLELLGKQHFDVSKIAHIRKIALLHGREDQIVSFDQSEKLNRMLPRSKLMIIEAAGHAIPITHAEWCCKTLTQMMCDS